MGSGTDNITMETNFFKSLFHNVSTFKVSNDLDEYFPKRSVFKFCLELDGHDMKSQFL